MGYTRDGAWARRLRVLALAAAVPYIIRLASVTVLPGPPLPPGGGDRNVVPFRTILQQATSAVDVDVFLRQIGGNAVLLMPLGLLLGAIGVRARRAGSWLLVTSAAIEVLQLLVVTGRTADVDDLLLNTSGGLVGWVLGVAVLAVATRADARTRSARRGCGTGSAVNAPTPGDA